MVTRRTAVPTALTGGRRVTLPEIPGLRNAISAVPGLEAVARSISWPSGPDLERSAVTGEYRIDDLARAAGTTVRNIRAYRERGLLMGPTRRDGRAGIYDESHLERLGIIDSLLQRGFTTAHIADFITGWESGKDLTEVLGLQHAVTAQWSRRTDTVDAPRELLQSFLGTDDIDGIDGTENTEDTETLERLAALGVIRINDDTVTFVQPQLLETFAELRNYGLQLPHLIDLFTAIDARVHDIAELMITAAESHIVDQHGPGWLPESDDDVAELTAMLNHLRELGVSSVHATLAAALDATLRTRLSDYLAAAAHAHQQARRQSS